MTLNTRTGRFRTWATIPDLPTCSTGASPCSPSVADGPAIPNYATWGPGGALLVSDYKQAVIWKIPRRTQQPRVWFASAALDGSEFGTTGIVFRPGRSDLLISQQSTTVDGSVPATGKLYRLPVSDRGRPGELETIWESLPGELPDGFGIARSGRVYLATVGTTQQIVVLGPGGRELERFPEAPGAGENGSPVPFDTPSNATFHGTRVLVANQSFFGNSDHHVILDVEVGERGRPPYLPRHAFWR
jgi:sugar lactone lactonase YvrE